MAVERVFATELASDDQAVSDVVDYVAHFRGKRLRPTLTLLAGHATGGITRDHHVIAAVVEMIHVATLVHDDVLDGATVRRHAETVHTRWDVPTSVLLGDHLFTHAFHLASSLGRADVCRQIGRATNRVCEGELIQHAEQGRIGLVEERYLQIIGRKTAELIAISCSLGATRNGDDTHAAAFAEYGRSLGIAFQIADDLLDFAGSEDEVGKTLGSDLGQAKLTLPVILALAEAGPQHRDRLVQGLRSGDRDERATVVAILEELGAIDATRARASSYAAQARAALGPIPPGPARDVLEAMTRFAVERSH